MRLAGIPGVVVHEKKEIKDALNEAIHMEDVGVILITEVLVKTCRDFIYDVKLNTRRPLIVEIPDRHGTGRAKDSITKYVRDAIGIKI
ncbi:MAG: V-type ATP synthase subunit F [Eubacteriales bacterium SKADARSKE-1]|nr:V-type ATP synthase subunit F [Eubacteriales bacterium SKADARSKE-1]